ncbi:MAG: hypothetical protein O6761_07175 [Thaumarchaeota archaeon]|nr:hypothetical protein [Nitrososphaerota archaeon]
MNSLYLLFFIWHLVLMKGTKIAITAGIIVLAFGTLFHLQGIGMVGPESSFMYQNSQWTTNGLIIAIIGAAILGVGIFMKKRT